MSEIQKAIEKLMDNRQTARMGGGQKAIDKQHEKGKYTAREPKGSQASSGVWRVDSGLLSRSCRKRRPSSYDDGGVSCYDDGGVS